MYGRISAPETGFYPPRVALAHAGSMAGTILVPTFYKKPGAYGMDWANGNN